MMMGLNSAGVAVYTAVIITVNLKVKWYFKMMNPTAQGDKVSDSVKTTAVLWQCHITEWLESKLKISTMSFFVLLMGASLKYLLSK